MQPFAIQLDDRAVAFARAGQLLSSAPSAIWDGSTGDAPGENAWHALRRQPTGTSTRHLGAILSQPSPTERDIALTAAELTRRLAANPPAATERVWIATPARATEHGLSAILAIAHNLSLPVDGFVDAAVATVAALGLEQSAIVLEIGMHHAAATYVDRDGAQARRRRSAILEQGGLMAFYQAWLELASTTMVKRTRFDPLHSAATEQQLFDSLGKWASVAAAEGSVNAVLSDTIEVTLTRDQFAQAGRQLSRGIAQLIHTLRPAGAATVLVLPKALSGMLGLEPFTDCELIEVGDGFAAAAVSQLDLPERAGADPARLLRRLPLMAEHYEREAKGKAAQIPPSHLLINGQVHPLTHQPPLVIGRHPSGPRTIALAEGLAGVSRRHCSLSSEGDEVILLDHSTFGTYVNEARVVERVRLNTGDRIRIGDPGIELALIAVVERGVYTPLVAPDDTTSPHD